MTKEIFDNIEKIPNFPSQGILFYDISPILANASLWKKTISLMAEQIKDMKPNMLVALESRGFLFAAPLAIELGIGFSLIRKKGKLPGKVFSHTYNLEYGTDTFEIKQDTINSTHNVIIVDDLLATGGTINAAQALLKMLNANILGVSCLIELSKLNGAEKIGIPCKSLFKV